MLPEMAAPSPYVLAQIALKILHVEAPYKLTPGVPPVLEVIEAFPYGVLMEGLLHKLSVYGRDPIARRSRIDAGLDRE